LKLMSESQDTWKRINLTFRLGSKLNKLNKLHLDFLFDFNSSCFSISFKNTILIICLFHFIIFLPLFHMSCCSVSLSTYSA
jgi:hypothetical protein